MQNSAWITVLLILCQFLAISAQQIRKQAGNFSAGTLTTDAEARRRLNQMDKNLTSYVQDFVTSSYIYNTNITDENAEAMNDASVAFSSMYKIWWEDKIRNYSYKEVTNEKLRRQFEIQQSIGTSILDEDDLKQLDEHVNSMTEKLSNKVCPYSDLKCDPETQGLTIDELELQMGISKDYTELLYYWERWRDVSGKLMTDDYPPYVQLLNLSASLNEFDDAGQMWLYPYVDVESKYTSDDFKKDIEGLWEELKEFYSHLHAYVRMKLQQYNSDYNKYIYEDGLIPAHILGNMYAQDWSNIYDIVAPYPNVPLFDITPTLQSKIGNVTEMFKIAEDFFMSIGMNPMTRDFWSNSLYEQPPDRDVVCHASASDFYSTTRDVQNGSFRIKMCTDKNQEDFITIHHEMGHIEYFMQYYNHPLIFRDGANPGFHEAIGDTIALSVSTPEHLMGIADYLNGTRKMITRRPGNATSQEANINFLMKQALSKVAFLPFAYIIDQWRWEAFDGTIPKDVYNTEWWRKRIDYQGIRPGVQRAPNTDFDIGCKYHVPANVPYIRYFVSTILQFQFHEKLCDVANITEPIFNCDIYKSTAAGTSLKEMLMKGRSEPWQTQLKDFVNGTMSAEAILKYFSPLREFLVKEIKTKNIPVGWSNSSSVLGDYISKGEEISAIVPIIVGIVLVVLVLIVVVAFFFGQHKRKKEEAAEKVKKKTVDNGKVNDGLELDEKNDIKKQDV